MKELVEKINAEFAYIIVQITTGGFKTEFFIEVYGVFIFCQNP